MQEIVVEMPKKRSVAKKKGVKKKNSKKKVTRSVGSKRSRSVPKKPKSMKVPGGFKKRRINLVLRNLLFFIVLFVLSLVLYSVSTSEIYVNLFLLLSIILGFLSLAFVLILLVLVFMRVLRR